MKKQVNNINPAASNTPQEDFKLTPNGVMLLKTIPLFPTPLFVYKFPRPFNKKELDFIKK